MNPFLTVLNDLGMGLANNATGPAGTLYLLLKFGVVNYGSTTNGNPYSAVRAALLASGGQSAALREIDGLLTSGENRWSTRRA